MGPGGIPPHAASTTTAYDHVFAIENGEIVKQTADSNGNTITTPIGESDSFIRGGYGQDSTILLGRGWNTEWVGNVLQITNDQAPGAVVVENYKVEDGDKVVIKGKNALLD